MIKTRILITLPIRKSTVEVQSFKGIALNEGGEVCWVICCNVAISNNVVKTSLKRCSQQCFYVMLQEATKPPQAS